MISTPPTESFMVIVLILAAMVLVWSHGRHTGKRKGTNMKYTTEEIYGVDTLSPLADMTFTGSCLLRVELLRGRVFAELDKPMLDRDMALVNTALKAIDFWNERIQEVT